MGLWRNPLGGGAPGDHSRKACMRDEAGFGLHEGLGGTIGVRLAQDSTFLPATGWMGAQYGEHMSLAVYYQQAAWPQ